MKSPLLILSGLISFSSFAQKQSSEYSHSIKLYNTLNYAEHNSVTYLQSPYYQKESRKNLQVLHPSVAYQWSNAKRNFHEIELSALSINRRHTEIGLYDSLSSSGQMVEDGVFVDTRIGLKYEYIFSLNKKKNARLSPSLGIGVNPYFERTAYKRPMISSSFSGNETEFGLRTFLIPRLCYHISSRVYLDLNVPLCLTNFSVRSQRQVNPSLPSGLTDNGVINFEAGPNYFSARIGLGIKI